ncbi:hypothetical protein MMC10_007973 [Thelotrema lepadinum]|nr:hypothetical protein [Thelotrema lepadinum]
MARFFGLKSFDMFHSFSNIFIAILFLIEQCSTSPTEQPPSLPYCTDFLIPVSAKAPSENLLLTAIPDLSNPTILVDFVTSHTTGLLGSLLGGTVSSTFNISARYCEPANQIANRSQIVQLLVHAITSTKDYWSGLSYPSGYNGEQYSWLAYASQAGFPTLSIDQLGAGLSAHPDPISVVQQPLQVAIIHSIMTSLRAGNLSVVSPTCPSSPSPPSNVTSTSSFNPAKGPMPQLNPNSCPLPSLPSKKIIFTGHSYGSICGNALATTYPSDADALILTGYTGLFAGGVPTLGSGILLPAATVNSARFGGLEVGYLAQSNEAGLKATFYTVDGLTGLSPSPQYTGDVLVVTGSNDTIVCATLTLGGDCGEGTDSLPAQASAFFPKARSYQYYIPPATGHAPDLHYSWPGTWGVVEEWLIQKGL